MMKALQVVHRCILSALLFFALGWLYLVLQNYLQSCSRSRNLRLLLRICVFAVVFDLVLFVLNEVQRKGSTHNSSTRSC